MAESTEEVIVPPGVTADDLARQAALRILDSEEPKEAPKAEEPKAEEPPKVEEPPKAGDEPKAEEPPKEAPAPVAKFKVKLREDDGSENELEVDEHELKNGYIRQQVYKKKTADLARERAQVKDEIQKGVEPLRKELTDKLALYEQALWKSLAPEIQNTDWNKLAAENPAEWTQRMQAVQNVQGVLAAIRQENEKAQAERAKELRANLENSVREAQSTLRERIPNWNNDLYGKILKAGTDHYRFKPEEVNAITDPRAIEVLNDARLYRELQQAKPQVQKKVAEVPKVVKPGAVERVDTNRENWNKGVQALKQRGGKERDAVALAAMLLEREGVK